MKKREFYLPSSDGKKQAALCGVDAGIKNGQQPQIRLWVQLVHGMNEHMGRYGEFASFLAEHGIAVIGHDCLGHGSTAPCKEERGFFRGTSGWNVPDS